MAKCILLSALLLLLFAPLQAQRQEINELFKKLETAQDDSMRWYCNIQLSANLMRINFDSARMYGERSLEWADKLQNPSCKARSINTLGAVYWNKGDHEQALKYYFQAMEISNTYNSQALYSTILGNIGLIYSDRKDHKLALEYLLKARKIKIETKDTIGLVRTLNNIGKVYTESNKPDSALIFYYECLPYFDKLPQLKQGKGIVLNNIGSILMDKKDNSGARKHLEASLKIREEIGDKGGMAVVLGNLGLLAQNEGNITEAIRQYERSLALSEETGSLTDKQDAWKKLYILYAEQKQFDKAFDYLLKYSNRQDTIYKKESAENIAEMEVKYQTAQKEAEIKVLESENRVRNLINYGALAGILALLVVLWLSRRTYRQRRLLQQATIDRLESERKVVSLNAHLEGQQRERLRISEDLHDDFGSGLSKISLLSEVVKKKAPMPELDKISASAKELLLKMSEIVWALNHRNDTLPSLAAYIRRYTSGFFEDTGIRCLFDIPDDLPNAPLTGEIRRNIFLVVKETLHNTLKHAGAGRVEITFAVNHHELIIQIADNGKGFDQKTISKAGNGLINMKNRMTTEGGDYELESEPGKGTITRLTLPLPLEEKAVMAA